MKSAAFLPLFGVAPECICCRCFFFSSRRRHTRCLSDWSSDVCSSDLPALPARARRRHGHGQRLEGTRVSRRVVSRVRQGPAPARVGDPQAVGRGDARIGHPRAGGTLCAEPNPPAHRGRSRDRPAVCRGPRRLCVYSPLDSGDEHRDARSGPRHRFVGDGVPPARAGRRAGRAVGPAAAPCRHTPRREPRRRRARRAAHCGGPALTAPQTPAPASQPMPMERAILWNPVKKEGGRPSGRAPYPVFFQQEAVVALQDHHKASPQQAIFGFLAGTLYRDPETGVLYAVIDKTLRLNQAIYGDKTEVVVARLWDRMQEQLARASGRLLGWYHSHPGQSLSLTTHDVETHVKFFTEPWQVAVLVAAEQEGVIGGFFRSGSSQAWAETPLAFYEPLQPDSIRAA